MCLVKKLEIVEVTGDIVWVLLVPWAPETLWIPWIPIDCGIGRVWFALMPAIAWIPWAGWRPCPGRLPGIARFCGVREEGKILPIDDPVVWLTFTLFCIWFAIETDIPEGKDF